MATWECLLPGRILSGPGQRMQAGTLARDFGQRVLLCRGSRPEVAQAVRQALVEAGLEVLEVCLRGEPTFAGIDAELVAVRDFDPAVVVAVGGGSVLDGAKALSLLLTNPGSGLDYAELIGAGQTIQQAARPLIAIPTTAGTGAEATRNSVLKHSERQVKVSLRHRSLLPQLVILDPLSLEGLPPSVIAHSGMDALCQLIEAFVSIKATPWTDALCRAGIPAVLSALPLLYRDPTASEARQTLQTAACWSGIALTNAGLGAAHGLAGIVGGLTDRPHGQLCAQFLAPVCRINGQALTARGGDLQKFSELARLITGASAPGDSAAGLESAWRGLEALVQDLGIEPFALGGPLDEAVVLRGAQASSSMKGNPVALTEVELGQLWRNVNS